MLAPNVADAVGSDDVERVPAREGVDASVGVALSASEAVAVSVRMEVRDIEFSGVAVRCLVLDWVIDKCSEMLVVFVRLMIVEADTDGLDVAEDDWECSFVSVGVRGGRESVSDSGVDCVSTLCVTVIVIVTSMLPVTESVELGVLRLVSDIDFRSVKLGDAVADETVERLFETVFVAVMETVTDAEGEKVDDMVGWSDNDTDLSSVDLLLKRDAVYVIVTVKECISLPLGVMRWVCVAVGREIEALLDGENLETVTVLVIVRSEDPVAVRVFVRVMVTVAASLPLRVPINVRVAVVVALPLSGVPLCVSECCCECVPVGLCTVGVTLCWVCDSERVKVALDVRGLVRDDVLEDTNDSVGDEGSVPVGRSVCVSVKAMDPVTTPVND
jgi:hypothetical protein